MKRSLRTLICAVLAAALLLPAVVYGAAASGSSTGEPATAAEDSQAQDELSLLLDLEACLDFLKTFAINAMSR